MFRSVLLSAALLALPVAGAAREEPAASVESVLAANRAAVGDVPRVGTETAEYAYSGQGMTGARVEVADLATGAFVDSYHLGLVDIATGYDGKTPWMRDLSGANTPQEGGDRVPLAINDAYRNANLWWRPGRGGAAITYAGRETIDGRPVDHLVVTPRGGRTFDAWFDAETHLLSRIAEMRLFFNTRVFFSDYAREGAVMTPRTVVIDGGAGEANYETLKLKSLRIAAARPLTAYARPSAPPTGVTIEGGAASATVPFRLLNNHIYVDVQVNGQGPFTFLVDTGGHTLLSPDAARRLGVKGEGAGVSAGGGDKIGTSSYARLDEIRIGAVRMARPTAIILQIYDPAIEGLPVDGMIGFELFRRLAVRTDYGADTLTFIDPSRFDPKGAGTEIPFKFYDHIPQVEGRIDELPALFDIDTGSRAEVDITSPSVARNRLRDRYAKGVTTITGWGVGGPSRSYVVRLKSLTLGGVTVQAPVAGLSVAKAGSFSDANFDGNIGSGLLKRFVVTFDYARQRMYLKPITPPPVDAGRFDRAGLWINAGKDGFDVTYVAEGGPAAEAGVAKGDVITAIAGEPARAAGLSDARTVLRATPAGTRLPVELLRDGKQRTVEIVLRDLI